ncbi:hypothetical protein G6F58_013554 [Rhizopus delemar]|nr:hypothetical protein G6F58_013554 [Rhizopus delemar]
MRRRSLALALTLLLPASAFAQALPQAAPAPATPAARSSATVVLANRSEIVLPAGAAKWPNKPPGKLVQRGDIVRVRAGAKDGEWLLDQLPRGQRWSVASASPATS